MDGLFSTKDPRVCGIFSEKNRAGYFQQKVPGFVGFLSEKLFDRLPIFVSKKKTSLMQCGLGICSACQGFLKIMEILGQYSIIQNLSVHHRYE
jgi:hypothetical protein